MEAASALPEGRYKLLRPDGEIVVVKPDPSPEPEPEPEPEPLVDIIRFQNTQFISAAKRAEIEGYFQLPAQDADGWTIDEIGPETKIYYIDAVNFDNDNATYYTSSQLSDPRNPTGVVAFERLEYAIASLPRAAGENYAAAGDYRFALRGGQSHSTLAGVSFPSGLSRDARCTITSFDGVAVIDDFGAGELRFWRGSSNITFLNISLYNKFRDPNHAQFAGWGNTSGNIKGGIQAYTPSTELGLDHVLIEGCYLNYCGLRTSGGNHEQLMLRRNVITNTYSEDTHQQGSYLNLCSAWLEENIYDHCGWFMQQIDTGNDSSMGQATMFNHSVYATNARYMVVKKNCFLRSSSIGLKLAANSKDGLDSVRAGNILIEDNYYFDGEIGISAGGNTDYNNGSRFEHVYILNNFIDRPGESQNTNRTLGWGTDIQDWQDGAHVGNIYRGSRNPAVGNVFAWHITGHCKNVLSAGNIAYNISPKDRELDNFAAHTLYQGDSSMENVVEWANQIQQHHSRGKLVRDDVVQGVEHRENYYFGASSQPERLFKRNGYFMGFTEWQSHQAAPNYNVKIIYKDPERDERSYMESLGFGADEFISRFTGQRRDSWDERFTAAALLAYLRDGFKIIGIETV